MTSDPLAKRRQAPALLPVEGRQPEQEEDGHDALVALDMGELCHLYQQRYHPFQAASAPFAPPCFWDTPILAGAHWTPRAGFRTGVCWGQLKH